MNFEAENLLNVITNPAVVVSIMETKLDQISQQIEQDKRAPMVFTCRNGVVLQIRSVPAMVLREVMNQIKEPRVPTFVNEEKGGRIEENPLDPEYLEAVEAYKNAQVDISNRLYLAYTKPSPGALPNDVEPPDSPVWEEDLKFVGIDVHESGRERYVDWLKFYVLTDVDFRDLMTAMYVAGGLVTEEVVKAAIESFPVNQNGPADTNISTRE